MILDRGVGCDSFVSTILNFHCKISMVAASMR